MGNPRIVVFEIAMLGIQIFQGGIMFLYPSFQTIGYVSLMLCFFMMAVPVIYYFYKKPWGKKQQRAEGWIANIRSMEKSFFSFMLGMSVLSSMVLIMPPKGFFTSHKTTNGVISAPAPIPTMEIISDQEIIHKEVKTDNKKYFHCVFQNATLVYDGGPFDINGCSFHGLPVIFSNDPKIISGAKFLYEILKAAGVLKSEDIVQFKEP
jgi:hypothetical protein